MHHKFFIAVLMVNVALVHFPVKISKPLLGTPNINMLNSVRPTDKEVQSVVEDKLRFNTVETLFLAVLNNYPKVVERVLLSGISANSTNTSGASPLHIAATYGRVNICQTLISFGADVKVLWEGNSPLHLAAGENQAEVVSTLVACGADINQRDQMGFTTLHIVSLRGNRSLANYLLAAGADPSLVDGDGKTVAERWNLTANSSITAVSKSCSNFDASDEGERDESGSAAVTNSELLKRFEKFRTFKSIKRAEPVTETFYAMKTYRSVEIAELSDFLINSVDHCGVPPSSVQRKVNDLLKPARRVNSETIDFELFCVVWLKAQTCGLL